MAARLIFAALLWLPLACLAFDHAPWDELLRKHVVVIEGGKASQLRYAGMAQDRSALKTHLEKVSAVKQAEFDGWSRAEQMAFLINAYNAFTVEKILTRYPDIRSIWDFGKLFGNPFKDEFFVLLEKKSSLDAIEHQMLRPVYRDPRVHYAVNCASIGCPMLRESRLEVSKIFDWFREDFEPREKYFARYAEVLAAGVEGRQVVSQGRAKLAFLDYDWSFNDAKK